MTDSILDAMTEQYNSMTVPERSWQIIFCLILQKLNIYLLHRWLKIPVYRKRLLPGFAVCWD